MIKALNTALIFTMAILLFLCGCNGSSTKGPSTSAIPQTTGVSQNDDAALFYLSVLQDYETIVRFRLSNDFEEKWNRKEIPLKSAELASAMEANPDAEWSNMVVSMTNGLDDPTQSSFGYVLLDINSDGFQELFWVREDNTVLAVFAKTNEKLALLGCFWNRHQCLITEKNELYIKTSGGGAYTDYILQILDAQGKLVQTKKFGTDGISGELETLFYEIVNGQKTAISEECFEELLREHPFEFDAEWLSHETIPLFG